MRILEIFSSKTSKAARRLAEEIEILHNTPLLDPVWYRQTYEDLRSTPIDCARHYLEHGAAEGRNPHPLFDTKFYLAQNPDVAASGANPLVHYLTIGWKEGVWPNKFFDPRWYLEQSPDVRAAGVEPLSHYQQWGWYEDRRPNASIDPIAYRTNSGLTKDTNPLLHFALYKSQEASASPSVQLEPSGDSHRQRLVREVHYEVWRATESLRGKNVCLFAAYAPDGYIPESTLHYIRSLRSHGQAVILIVASRNSGRPHADTEIVSDGLISRDNRGYDFASWALGLQILPSIWEARSIAFTNDSIFGPLSQPGFTRLMDRLNDSQADYVALTQSWQVRHHYQSYFFVLKRKALSHPSVKKFWATLEIVPDRDQAIVRYEVPMLDMMKRFGLEPELLFPLGGRDFEKDMNPTLDHWRELIKSGFPFVKVQTLRDDISGVDKSNWGIGLEIEFDVKRVITDRLESKSEKRRKISVVRPGK